MAPTLFDLPSMKCRRFVNADDICCATQAVRPTFKELENTLTVFTQSVKLLPELAPKTKLDKNCDKRVSPSQCFYVS